MSSQELDQPHTLFNQESIGKRLVGAGLISNQQLHEALQLQPHHGQHVGSLLVSIGALTETALLQFLSHQYGIPAIHEFPKLFD